uniref:mitogen-activated protein kinase kinase n=1 Tax=Acrobeloides nanus TaxID=290746 RepID=A0A914DVA0_9BILA
MDISLSEFYKAIHREHGEFDEILFATIGVSIIDGLEYLNCQDIVHRDVKPANIMVNKNGAVKLCDFGESRLRFKDEHFYANFNETPAGTLYYWPPERFSGQPVAGVASDVWSLGITLLEVGLGHVPFIDNFGNLIEDHVKLKSMIEDFDAKLIISKLNKDYEDATRTFLHLCLLPAPQRPSTFGRLQRSWYYSNTKEYVKSDDEVAKAFATIAKQLVSN